MGHRVTSKVQRALAVPAVGLILGVGGLALTSTPASAACSPYGPSACTSPGTGTGDGVTTYTGTSSSGSTAATTSSSALAFTGTDVAVTVSVGAGAIAAGGMVVLASRRRRVQA